MRKIYLSPPDIGNLEGEFVAEAFASNWVAPLGPQVDAFEREVAETVNVRYALALSSGTAGLHLALKVLGIGQGDEVVVSTLTFAASANAVAYLGARPVFVDSDRRTWNMDPELLAEYLELAAKRDRVPKAVVVVDLYGQCADFDPILEICGRYNVPVVEDAAEALGSTYKGRAAGGLGAIGVFSFNGNKIITTGGGGMLVSNVGEWVDTARFLATQARDAAPHYEHSTIGYNYRLSNILAAIGRGQLRVLEDRVQARRNNNAFYRMALADVPGVEFMPEAEYGQSNCWLTCLTLDEECRVGPEEIRRSLAACDIEVRPVWKPMHMQPIFRDCRVVGGNVAEDLFRRGICLPSGSSLHQEDRERVAESLRSLLVGV